ncbi:DUF4279 domain-containing protein [Acidisoma silvae]|uniref:DUF4279 domain-containing protein n=1 Tax=Acidisoma silvae TaxID=2802396 RepID=A0A964DXL8_9PROT|nr:DUF4279 domain-containing protein [Acidisoma silvae]MCB8874425.1 DUF4279 domain-containing protein [Acidisoma silvae]
MSSEDEDYESFIVLDVKGDKLDPTSLLALIPLTCKRPRRKGDPMGQSFAKTGYCGFTVDGRERLRDGTAHLRLILDALEPNIAAIQIIMQEQSLAWQATFFEGNYKGHSFSELSPDLLRRAANIGLPVVKKEPDTVTFVWDYDPAKPRSDS